jgi:hypothetical protein
MKSHPSLDPAQPRYQVAGRGDEAHAGPPPSLATIGV